MCDVVSQLFTSLFCLLSMMIICGGYHSILFLNVSLITLLFRIILNREKNFCFKNVCFWGELLPDGWRRREQKNVCFGVSFQNVRFVSRLEWRKKPESKLAGCELLQWISLSNIRSFGFHNISQSLSNITAICWI